MKTLLFLILFVITSHAQNNTINPGVNSEAEESFAVLILLAAMLVTFLVGYILHQTKFQYIHEAGAAMLLGLIIGAIIRYTANSSKLRTIMIFNQEAFFILLLPPIIFESGYNMKRGHFFYNMSSISLFAFVGTLISMAATGGMVYLFSGILGWTGRQLSLSDAMIFGSLISATDPVSTLSIFQALNVDRNLYANVFGESVLNDAVAIVLYRTIAGIAGDQFGGSTVLFATLDFLKIFFGSFAIAIVTGLLSCLLFKYTELNKYPTLEMVIVILYAFCAYLLAEGLHLSGIVSILFCGIIMAHYTYNNLSKQSQIVTKEMFKVFASITEMIVFTYLGLAIFTFDSQDEFSIGLILLSFPILLIARALNIFPLSFIINIFRPQSHKIPFNHMIMMWFSGLRGAIAFALALSVPTPAEKVIFSTTLIIVLVSVIIFGGATVPLLNFLKIKMNVPTSNDDYSLDVDETVFNETNWFMKIDRAYVKPIFIKNFQRPQPSTDINADSTAIQLQQLDSDISDEDDKEAKEKFINDLDFDDDELSERKKAFE